MSQDDYKRQAAKAAIQWIKEQENNSIILGVGTGTTVKHFIESIELIKNTVTAVLSSSIQTTRLLVDNGIKVADNNQVINIDYYVDGADEINSIGEMIKGGGGALTGEKILSSMSNSFICIADESKKVDSLGSFPLAIEVLPEARSYVSRKIVTELQAQPELRQGFITDRGNFIIDIYNIDLTRTSYMENKLNGIAGIVENGIFTNHNKASISFLASANGVNKHEYK